MMQLVLVACLAAVAKAVPSVNGTASNEAWCIGASLTHAEVGALSVPAGKHFRGAFRDITLWLEDSLSAEDAAVCERFDKHVEGNDGLWVIEYDHNELMVKERVRILELGVEIKAHHGKTLIVGGGMEASEKLGYDACGSEQDKSFISVPSRDVVGPKPMLASLKNKYKELLKEKRPLNLELLEFISEAQLTDMITRLQAYDSRNSFAGDNGLNQAADMAEAVFAELGFEVRRDAFREDMTPQIVATLRGTEEPDEIVVVGAHYDSRGTMSTSPTQRAPGADDNGSGSASVLEFARVIHETGATFRKTLKLCLFTGEEQGLIGSRALASQYADEGENIIAMFNADMIGYAPEGDDIILAYMNRNADPDLTELSRDITELYVPEVQTDLTNVCCSDQQSFYENGFPSVGFFETPNPSVVYPQYHTSDDLLQFLSTEKIYLLAKATLASAIVFAEPVALVHHHAGVNGTAIVNGTA